MKVSQIVIDIERHGRRNIAVVVFSLKVENKP